MFLFSSPGHSHRVIGVIINLSMFKPLEQGLSYSRGSVSVHYHF